MMDFLDAIKGMILLIVLLYPIYLMAKGNTDYKQRQRYGIPRYHESDNRR